MKKFILTLIILVSSLWAENSLAWFKHGNATSSNLNLRQENFFGLTGSAWQSPAGYYVPGTGNPAISTADYYHADGARGTRPFDLLDAACGSAGASIAAAKGRYAWFISADHSDGYPWSDGQDIYLGFSSDPGVLPSVVSSTYARWRLTPLAQSATVTAKIDNGAGGAGNILTVTAITGAINYNSSSVVTGAGVTQATIGGPYTGSAPGGIGTYVLSGAAQNVASQAMTISQVNLSIGNGAFLACNPDDLSFPFYFYAEASAPSSGLEQGLIKSADLVTWTDAVPAFVTQLFSQFAAYQTPLRTGVNTWVSLGNQGAYPQTGNAFGFAKWTSINGREWTPNPSTLINTCLPANASGTFGATPCTTTPSISTEPSTPIITVASQNYVASRANTTVNSVRIGNQWVSRLPIDANYNLISSPSRVDISTPYAGRYPGQTYLQDVKTYQEDGIAHYYAPLGFPPSNGQLNGVASARPYLNGGACVQSSDGSFTAVGSISTTTLHISSTPTTIPVGAQIMFGPTPAFITAQIATQGADVATYTIDVSQTYSSGNMLIATCGGLWQQGVDYYTEIVDTSAAATAAPIGVKASCSSSTATLNWFNSLPQQTYRLYRGTTVGSQTTLVGDFTGTIATDTGMTLNQITYYKLVYLHSGVEQKNRVVNTWCSSDTAFVNAHYTRASAGGADMTTCNRTMIVAFDAWLTSNSLTNNLLLASMPDFCVAKSGSQISKVFDMGTTHLPRGGDYTPTSPANTTYSATGINSKPAWVNGTGSAYGYYGNGRLNNIRRKTQITLFAAYQKPGTAVLTPFVMGQFTNRMMLTHGSGSPGTVSCLITDATHQVTVTAAPASATAVNTASCTFDGTNWTAYANATAGTPDSTLVIPSPNLAPPDNLTGQIDGTGVAQLNQLVKVLFSGSDQGLYQLGTGYNPGASQSLGSYRGLFVLDKALTGAQQTSLDALVR